MRITGEDTANMQNKSSNNHRRSINLSKTGAQKLILILLCLVAGFFGGMLGSSGIRQKDNTTNVQRQIISNESQLINQIVKDVGPSVVSVNVTSASGRSSFFGQNQAQQSAGTGVILNSEGVIITNRHVVPAETSSVSVTLSDGTTLDDVDVIGRTNDSDSLDVAFLKVNDAKGKTLQPAKLADSSKVQVGDKVVAIGNALGQFQNTVTSGIISGYGRSVDAGDESGMTSETLQNLFQTDASINPGNSGGPLVNMNSEVIAINTAVAGNAENIGFAIPINDIQGLINSVLKDGKLVRPYLGVRYISLTDDIAYQYNLSVKRGAYLAPSQGQASILEGSPADKAGLQEKDIITKIDNTKIDENNSLTSTLGRYSAGDTVTLTIVRDGKEQTVKATLEAAPQQ
ncbi:MAG: serine protease Do [Patescibacteria group bacterium]|jgi:serine protease Do|nr:serine protease Do [Patescibacteria group bacterium]